MSIIQQLCYATPSGSGGGSDILTDPSYYAQSGTYTGSFSTVGTNPAIRCGAPYGNTGWFTITNSDTANTRVTLQWNGVQIKEWEYAPSNTATFDVDGYAYRLDYNRNSQTPSDVLTKLADTGWDQSNCSGGSNTIWAGPVKRSKIYSACPTNIPTVYGENPSAACGAPYGEGWFNRQDNRQTIIVLGGTNMVNIMPGTGSGTYETSNWTFNRVGSSTSIPYGWANNGQTCGSLSEPSGDFGQAFCVEAYRN